MNEVGKIIGDNISQLRKENKLTQVDFGKLFSYSDKTVSKWECGSVYPSIETIMQIAEYFNIPIENFFKRDGLNSIYLNKKKEKDNYIQKIILVGIASCAIWTIAVVIYVASLLNNTFEAWKSLIWAIPFNFILLSIAQRRMFKNRKILFVYYSLTVWTLLGAFYVIFIENWFLFFIGVPIQVSLILIYQLYKDCI